MANPKTDDWAVVTNNGTLVLTFETKDAANVSAEARNKTAIELGIETRYHVVENDKSKGAD